MLFPAASTCCLFRYKRTEYNLIYTFEFLRRDFYIFITGMDGEDILLSFAALALFRARGAFKFSPFLLREIFQHLVSPIFHVDTSLFPPDLDTDVPSFTLKNLNYHQRLVITFLTHPSV